MPRSSARLKGSRSQEPPKPELSPESPPGKPNMASALASETFTFLVGPNKKRFHIHKDLVARLSQPLSVLVSGGMREARENQVEWPDVDEETFIRFSQYAYTGDYTEAEPRIVEESTAGAAHILAQCAQFTGLQNASSALPGFATRSKSVDVTRYVRETPFSLAACFKAFVSDEERSNRQPAKKRKLLERWSYEDVMHAHEDVQARAIEGFRHRIPILNRHGCIHLCDTKTHGTAGGCSHAILNSGNWTPRENHSPLECYVPLLSSHLRLCVLANKYLIKPLEDLTCHRIHRTLWVFKHHCSVRVCDIVKFAREVWDSPHIKLLRVIIYAHFRCIADQLYDLDEFDQLVKDHPDFALSFIRRACFYGLR